MLTKVQIEAQALEFVAHGEAPLWGRGFVNGATWANEQNAQEIAELVDALRELYDNQDGAPGWENAIQKAALAVKIEELLSKYEK